MRLNPTNNYENNVKPDVSSRAFNAGTAELLSNVLNIPISYDYQNKDGDTLSLSSSGKQQISQDDLLAVAKMVQGGANSTPAEQIPQEVKDFLTKFAAGSSKGTNTTVTDQIPDAVKNYFKTHSLSDLQQMSLDQVPNDVKSYVKGQLLTGTTQGYHGMVNINAVNTDDTARKLVYSLFVNAGSQDSVNDGQDSSNRNDNVLKQVTNSLNQIFDGLNKNSGQLPTEVKNDLNSIYALAQQKINSWAEANGLKIVPDK